MSWTSVALVVHSNIGLHTDGLNSGETYMVNLTPEVEVKLRTSSRLDATRPEHDCVNWVAFDASLPHEVITAEDGCVALVVDTVKRRPTVQQVEQLRNLGFRINAPAIGELNVPDLDSSNSSSSNNDTNPPRAQHVPCELIPVAADERMDQGGRTLEGNIASGRAQHGPTISPTIPFEEGEVAGGWGPGNPNAAGGMQILFEPTIEGECLFETLGWLWGMEGGQEGARKLRACAYDEMAAIMGRNNPEATEVRAWIQKSAEHLGMTAQDFVQATKARRWGTALDAALIARKLHRGVVIVDARSNLLLRIPGPSRDGAGVVFQDDHFMGVAIRSNQAGGQSHPTIAGGGKDRSRAVKLGIEASTGLTPAQ
eukprot:5720748-Amphidinium_carterae.1